MAIPALAPKILALCLDPKLRKDEADLPLYSMMRHPATREIAWRWFRSNFDGLVRRIPATEVSALPLVSRRFCSKSRVDEVKSFFQPKLKTLPGAASTLQEALESIELCSARSQAQTNEIRDYFAAHPAKQ